jgi:hypothetical protein
MKINEEDITHAPWYFTLTFVPRRGSKGKGKRRGYNSLFKKRFP